MNAVATIEPSLIAALAKALPELESAKKNKANPAFKSKYADLAAVIEALEPITRHGLWYRQHQHENENGAMIETFYIHESGQEMSAGCVFMPATKKDAQGFGSALSYARRYGLQTAFGLATEDDDGNAAVKSTQAKSAPAPAQRADVPEGPLTDMQWAIITDLITQTHSDSKAFCTAFKVPSVKDLPAAQFDRARAMLNKKLAAMVEEPA
ncbi:MAG: hypothetical protein B7Y89_06160 [Novosphingobium sp. 32-60-15]|uniref:ERF family protein n=1 Tax=unclassified Novosphingobium TaxID=2644732 RepID=UPI000BC42793|nr:MULTISPECIES: ERF family protein [unclassified Novosphingobium]OYX63136.1 MAG: hypothetical protein B7Y89_06160 [Novosphingobium sp. 32-60-15]